MKKLSIALAAAFVISIAAPAVAADYTPPPPPAPSCADYHFLSSIWCYIHGPGPYHGG